MSYHNVPVRKIIKEAFPYSFFLGIKAFLCALIAGIICGSCITFMKKKGALRLGKIFLIINLSIPAFVLASLLQYFFAIKLSLSPITGASLTVLPVIALAAFPAAFIARLFSANMCYVLQQDYIVTAYAKGLSFLSIFCRHVFKNSMIPLISYLAPLFCTMTIGSFIVERIFNIPGMGRWFVASIINRDYMLTLGITLFYSVFLLFSSFLVDLFLFFLDPRIRFTWSLSYARDK